MAKTFTSKKLNVGCGRNILEGWVNLDMAKLPGVDVIADLEQCEKKKLPFADNSFDEFLLSHVIEHIKNPLPLMQELWRVASPGAKLQMRVPHGASDDAWEDPTHVRPYFMGSFGYFSQPLYWRADYGYRGDWQVQDITFVVKHNEFEGLDQAAIAAKMEGRRNVVQEMVAQLECVKPAREPKKELQRAPVLKIQLA